MLSPTSKTPRTLRKFFKTNFRTAPPKKAAASRARVHRGSLSKYGSPRPAPIIFAMRHRRKRAKVVRFALRSGGKRLPPYIRLLLQAENSIQFRSRTIATMPGAHKTGVTGQVFAPLDKILQKAQVVDGDRAKNTAQEGPAETEGVAPSTVISSTVQSPSASEGASAEQADSSSSFGVQLRQLVPAPTIEMSITAAMKALPGCEAFIGVFIKQMPAKSGFDANWVVQGVRFGKTDRKTASEALASIVARMQSDFSVPDR
jgi:hypothetical protein